MIKVLAVDDHAVVRRGVVQILHDSGERFFIAEAASAAEALRAAQLERFDVVLLDLALPDRSGLDVLNELHKLQPGLHILILSIYPEDQYAVRALKAGADGYLTKESAPEELFSAVHKVIKGGKYITQSLAERLAVELATPSSSVSLEGLSDRELQVMRMLAEGYAIKETAIQLSISPKTVSTYRARILKKLGMNNTSDIIRFALTHGLANDINTRAP